jgi:hypothetical protein
MINNRGMARAGAAMLACGTAALLALTGCSSGSSSSSAAGGATGATGAAASAAASPSSSAPSWASALGSGVTVVAPGTAAPGNDSPGAAITGFIDALDAKKYSAVCPYALPSVQSQCRTALGSVSPSVLAPHMPFAKNAGLGYVAIDGTEALVGTTGEYCAPGQTPECFTNNDPAAIFNSGKSFSALWKAAVAATNSNSTNVYALFPCQEVGGKWYGDLSPS